MKCLLAVFGFPTVFFLLVSGEHTEKLTWSKTFSYEAILNIPGAGIVQPYKVWVDGSGNTKVDYYNGLDKFYRIRMYGGASTFQFFKVQPEVVDEHSGPQEVCHQLEPGERVNVYSLNIYMPTPRTPFTFEGYDFISSVKCQKWVSKMTITKFGYDNLLFTSTVWVVQEEVGDQMLAKPLRYDYVFTVGNVTVDEFSHVYLDYNFTPIDPEIFKIPNALPCKVKKLKKHEPIDYLIEFTHPLHGFKRIHKIFKSFKSQHNKKYKSDSEHFMRMNTFLNNLRYIDAENKKNNTYKLAVNHLADRTKEELTVFLGTKKDDVIRRNTSRVSVQDVLGDDDETDVYDNFDWRDYNATTPVKDQTTLCGSCYAFATAAVVESSLYIQNGFRKMNEVSEQAIVDCTWSVQNSGCEGGILSRSLQWIRLNGVPYKHEYGPYLAMEGLCHHSSMAKLGAIKGYFPLMHGKAKTLKKILSKRGPLLAGINPNPSSFLFYSGGVYNHEECDSKEDSQSHAVVIIGYGVSDGQAYWIIKNTFGSSWGENGHMKIAIKNNVCGLTNMVYTVNAKTKS